MGSTGEADKKRRHFSSISPTAGAAKKQPLAPLSEEKKNSTGFKNYGDVLLDAAVLQFQNQKLIQKLETQKVEINALEDRLCHLKDKQQSYEKTLAVVNSSWEELVDDLESRSNCTLDSLKHGRGFGHHLVKDDGDSLPEDALLSRLLETGATESSSTSSASTILNPTEEDRKIDGGRTKNPKSILPNIVASFDDLNNLKHRLYTVSLKTFSSNGQSQKVVSSDLLTEVKNLRIAVLKLHLKHKSLAGELQSHRDTDAKNKAVLKHLKGELESTISELEESNRKLAILKAERDVAKGAFFPVLNRGNKQATTDKARDKQRELQEMESSLKELLDQSTSRLHELKRLHGERLDILRHLSDLQLKGYSDHIQRLAEDRVQNAAALENTQRRLSDVRKSSQQLMGTLDEAQSQVEGSRASLAQLQIALEKERFERKRVEEDLDTLRRKAEQLKSEAEGSSVAEKLRQELREYKEILKCSVCLDRRKESNETVSVLVYKELLRRVTVSAQFVLQALGLMTSNPYTSDQKFQVMLPGFDSMVPFEPALVHPG
ncbi:UNVERIFIED_CONTAM: E3 ubiquitin-protein ligase BRE1-like 1 [Sesamum radiatum]|uniref:E3 ubiquitin protein ligase n=1 Tax=Sesamum radiatum TaxID=300843 RepID=A0AAW2VDR3_SESRA